MNLLQLPLVSC